MGLQGLILFSAMTLCLVTSTAVGMEEPKHDGSNNNGREILDVQTNAELRSILNKVRVDLVPSNCSDWNEDVAQAAAVFNFRGLKELWIGTEYSDTEELSVEGLLRMYEIRDLSMGGSPLQGSIQIRLPTQKWTWNERVSVNSKGYQSEG